MGKEAPPNTPSVPVFLLIAVVLFVALALYFALPGNRANGGTPTSGYQAVFLTSGQTYFGKLSRAGSQAPILTDVFYLPEGTSLQTGEILTSAEVTLIKLGQEFHGPTDRMVLNRDQIIFWEDLGENSKVVQAINSYYAQNP